MSTLRFIIPTNTPTINTLIPGYSETGAAQVQELVRDDKTLAISVEPVTINESGSDTLYSPDYESTDIFRVGIGLADQPATGGTFKLTAGSTTTNLTAIAYNVTGAALTTPLSAAFVAEGKPANAVTLLSTGVYQIDASANGAITTGFLVADGALLQPQCDVVVTEQSLGSASSRYQLLLVIRASPVAYAEPSTALTTAGVTVSTTQAGSTTANKIQKIAFDAADTYGGTFSLSASVPASAATITTSSVANPSVITTSAAHGFATGDTITISGHSGSTPSINATYTITVVSDTTFSIPVNVTVAGTGGTATKIVATTCGVATPGMSAQALGQLLSVHPQIYYQETDGTPDNVLPSVSGSSYFVQFIGTLGQSNTPALTAANIDLVAAQGRSGTISLNTIALYKYSLTQTGNTFTMRASVQRERASGEIRTIFLADITLSKDIIDVSSMVPVPRPSYYTSAQSLAYFVNSGDAFGILSLSGGGATNLDSVITAAQSTGRAMFVNDSTYGFGLWVLAASTHAEDIASGFLRPDDYDGTTNQKVWVRYS